MKKLIQFKNIVKEFDGQLVLKGINLDASLPPFGEFPWIFTKTSLSLC